jgi:hypothetical protein
MNVSTWRGIGSLLLRIPIRHLRDIDILEDFAIFLVSDPTGYFECDDYRLSDGTRVPFVYVGNVDRKSESLPAIIVYFSHNKTL